MCFFSHPKVVTKYISYFSFKKHLIIDDAIESSKSSKTVNSLLVVRNRKPTSSPGWWLRGESVVPICQGCGFNPPSGHTQESTNECISKRNTNSCFSPLPLPSSIQLIFKNLKKNPNPLQTGLSEKGISLSPFPCYQQPPPPPSQA